MSVSSTVSAVPPSIVMESATTTDSFSVTITYDVNTPPDPSQRLTFGIYRSASNQFNASDLLVGTETIVAPGQGTTTLDVDGQPAANPGPHQLTIPLPGGLSLNPEHPYVLVVANPAQALASGDPGAAASASFRTYVIGVVSHGGIQDPNWKNGPPWELVMATLLKREGYDVVIPFNWVAESGTPGAAARQGGRLARRIINAVEQFPATAPVDLQLIGHSEGNVVNDQALLRLESATPRRLRAGYIELTMLDPHAANADIPGQQYSVGDGPLAWLAKGTIDSYQAQSRDPPASVPSIVDQAQVFYQHTPASRDHGVNGGLYNLWGQVPVHGPAYYFNLTGDGATHSGKTGVMWWYIGNIVPLLGDGAPELQARILTGALAPASTAPGTTTGQVINTPTPTFTGTALAGSEVYLYGGPAHDPSVLIGIGRTTVEADGRWSLTTRPLTAGRYRIMAIAVPPRNTTRDGPRLLMLPTAPLGLLDVAKEEKEKKKG
jgi:hypothetical protein